jgi:hypothetical protein
MISIYSASKEPKSMAKPKELAIMCVNVTKNNTDFCLGATIDKTLFYVIFHSEGAALYPTLTY